MIGSALSVLRRRGPMALLGAAYWLTVAVIQRRLFGRRFLQKRIHGHDMLLDLEDRGISRTLLLFGTRELEHLWILRRVLRPGMTVLDVGANIGYYALIELDLIGQDGCLIAVEPSPPNVELLRRNLALNGYEDVLVHQAAVSDAAGTATFYLSEMSNLGTFHPIGTGAQHLSGQAIEVPTVTVPQLVDGRPPDLLRMDVEGHEVEVIIGMLDEIESGSLSPMILFETHLSRYSEEHDMAEVLRRLFAAGYRARYVGSSSERGTRIIEELGYRSDVRLRTDDVERDVFTDVANEDLVRLVTVSGGARTVLLSRAAG